MVFSPPISLPLPPSLPPLRLPPQNKPAPIPLPSTLLDSLTGKRRDRKENVAVLSVRRCFLPSTNFDITAAGYLKYPDSILAPCTGIGARMSYRKWRENEQQLIRWPELVLLGCCLVSLYFRCDILAPIPVWSFYT